MQTTDNSDMGVVMAKWSIEDLRTAFQEEFESAESEFKNAELYSSDETIAICKGRYMQARNAVKIFDRFAYQMPRWIAEERGQQPKGL